MRRCGVWLSGIAMMSALALPSPAAATWSIVIADTESGEVAVGTVTCLTNFDLLALVPVVVVGKGGAAVQAAGDFNGLRRPIIWEGLQNGTLPADMLELLAEVPGHQDRQYGIVDTRGARITFTGETTFQWAGGVTGSQCSMFYAIQGNILAGGCVVPAIEQALRDTPGDMAAKLMAGMQAARAAGGDGRCSCSPNSPEICGCPPSSFSKSGHIGGMVVARIGDVDDDVCDSDGCADGDYFLRINVAFQAPANQDPVEQLQAQFDAWRSSLAGRPDAVQSTVAFDPPAIPPDGSSQTTMTITLLDWQGWPIDVAVPSLSVVHAGDSAGLSSIADVVDQGNGLFTVTLTAGSDTGVDRFMITADDGVRPVVLMPEPALEYCMPGDCLLDCNGNGVVDACDIGDDSSQDCNYNVIPDECDIAQGTSGDCDDNGVPDECEDCNNNGFADSCDIADGSSSDIDGNGVPDECHQIFFVPSAEYPTIQAAVDSAEDGDSVLAEDGVYTGDGNREVDFGGRAIFLRSIAGPQDCVIDCQGAGRAFIFQSGETAAAVVDGFTVTNCDSNLGAGVYCINDSSPTIRQCIFTNNTAGVGAAFYANASHPTVSNCLFDGNTASSRGGGLYATQGVVTISQCTFSANTAGNSGGGVYCNKSAMNLVNSILWNNSAPSGPEILVNGLEAMLTVHHCDVEGGEAGVQINGGGLLEWGPGNLDSNPMFVDAASADYRLAAASPCIDMADTDAVPADIVTDLEGQARVYDGNGDGVPVVDMGSDEFVCAADLDTDGAVGIEDLSLLIMDWGPCPPPADCPSDLNGDDIVDAFDLAVMLGAWGVCP